MFDFSFGELALIGTIALIVLGPERLPKVARTVGEWAGKAQRYVTQVKADINREIEVSELKKLQEQAMDAARTLESSVKDNLTNLQSDLSSSANLFKTGFDDPQLGSTASSAGPAADYSWEGAGDVYTPTIFNRRYKPGPSVDELSEEIARLKRQLAMPEGGSRSRHKYAPRARLNRPRIRR
jgi:sec-independent protein translocase protein TatB